MSEPANITNNEFYKLMLLQQQLQKDFDVEDFSRKMGLLRFSFVRHPFERYAHGLISYSYTWRSLFTNFRLISAYEDKLSHYSERGCHDRLCLSMVDRNTDMLWPSFAIMILDMADEKGCLSTSDCLVDSHIR